MSDVRVYKRLVLDLALTAAAVTAAALWGPFLLRAFAPCILGLLFAWLLDPVVKYLNRKTGLGHRACSIIVCLLCFAVVGTLLGVLIYSVINELFTLASAMQGITDSIEGFATRALTAVRNRVGGLPESMSVQVMSAVSNLMDGVNNSYSSFISSLTKSISGYALKMPSWLLFAAAFIVGTVMFSFRIPMYRGMISQGTDSDPDHPVNLVKRVLRTGLGGYLRATLILGAWVGFLCMIGFFIMGQPYAVLLGLLMAVCDILPNFGAGAVLIPWGVILLFTGDTSGALILFITVAVTSFTRNLIYPKVMGSQTGLSPLLTVISSFVGWKLVGVVGMIIGPIFAVVVVNILASGIFSGISSDLKVLYSDVLRKFSSSGDA